MRRKAGDVHSVQPSMVSISQATESGSVYTLDEIRELAAIAKDAGLRVHLDGARFANALDHLGASPAELTWQAGIDVLSFGATKNGAMTATRSGGLPFAGSSCVVVGVGLGYRRGPVGRDRFRVRSRPGGLLSAPEGGG